ncbi:MAG: hypothetical protein QMC80_01770 [Thermoplasmatales archaeon]|nr:hypothetical protein [Thermoplasmatales archaeon]
MGQHGHRNMYYMTGLPGWMRFGYSPGWGGMPPMANYLMQTGQMPQAMNWFQQQMPMGPQMPTTSQMPMQTPMGMPMQTPPEQEKQMLNKQVKMLGDQIKQMKERLKEIEKEG